jgi:hypothetical protein
MNLQRILALGAVLAVVSSSAIAFQEQRAGAPAPSPAPSANADTPTQELNVPSAATKAEGTEVTIPGLGKLGVLPKMDFGLELLYGANEEPKEQDSDPAQQARPEDHELTIRGSVKKSF